MAEMSPERPSNIIIFGEFMGRKSVNKPDTSASVDGQLADVVDFDEVTGRIMADRALMAVRAYRGRLVEKTAVSGFIPEVAVEVLGDLCEDSDIRRALFLSREQLEKILSGEMEIPSRTLDILEKYCIEIKEGVGTDK